MTIETPAADSESPAGEPEGTPEGGNPADPVQGLTEARDRYRGERDTAREELATAQSRIEALNRREVERLAAEHLAVPGDFWLSENAVADYLTEDGNVDAERVAADARTLIQERPRLSKHSSAFDPSQGLGGKVGKPELSWGALFS